MSEDTAQVKPERLTLSGQLNRLHELLMAQATKQPRTAQPSVEFGERATGTASGSLYVKSLVLIQDDDETAEQFLERQRQSLADTSAMLAEVNGHGAAPAAASSSEDS